MSCIERLVAIRIVLIDPDDGTNLVMVKCRMADDAAGAPPAPPNLAQAIAAMLTGRDEHMALLRQHVEQGAAPWLGHHPPPASGY